MTKRLALTETAIAKAVKIARATEQRARLPDPGMPGLWLAIGATGTTRWEARVRVAADGSAPRWIGLDDYPDIGLAVGRTRCEAVRVAARAGTDLAGLRSMFGTTRAAPVPTLPPPLAPVPTDPAPPGPAPDSLTTKLKLYEAQGDPGKSWPHSRKRIERVFKAQLTQPVGTLTAVALQEAADTYPADSPPRLPCARCAPPCAGWPSGTTARLGWQ